MTTPLAPPPPRRRRWPWILAILASPVVVLAVAAASYLTLNRDAAVLRREVMAATAAHWDTRVQLSPGRFTFWLARQGLAWVSHPEAEQARAALNAIHSASVGVYHLRGDQTNWSRERLFATADRAMAGRGWARAVGVADDDDHVLIYVPADNTELERVCLAVISDRELVVVSAAMDAEGIVELISPHLDKSLRGLRAARRR